MAEPAVTWLWLGSMGAFGGLVNAALTSDGRALWTAIAGRRAAPRMVRIGWLANVGIGVAMSCASGWACLNASAGSIDLSLHRALSCGAAGLVISLLATRLVTNEIDKRLLRDAACLAAAAPAAHPDVVTLFASATPGKVYVTALDLLPRRGPQRSNVTADVGLLAASGKRSTPGCTD